MITNLSLEHANLTELSYKEQKSIQGGFWVELLAIAAVAEGINILYQTGKNLGEFIYHASH